ncbi:MAG: tetratricopeptide repeat-containing sensor histidine kinase [Bacteroidia bacterium]
MTASYINNNLKVILVSLFLIGIIKKSYAQNSSFYLNKYKDAYSTNDDTIKLDALIKLSTAYQYVNLDSCVPIANRAKILQEKLGASSFIPRVYNTLASAYINVQQSDSSFYWLHQSFKVSKEKNDLKQIASCLNNFGVYYANLGESLIALSFYNKSLFIRESIKDSLGIASSFNNIANLKLRFGYYAEGRFLLLQAIRMKQENFDTISVARSFVNLSNIYVSESNFNKSIQCLKQAEKWLEYTHSESEKFSILTNLGATYYYQNDLVNAKREFEKSLENAIQSKNLNNEIIACNNLGEVENLLGNYSKAEYYFFNSLKLCKKVKDLEGEASSNIGCAEVYKNKNDLQTSIRYLIKGIEISEANQFKPILVSAYTNLYNAYKEIGDFKKATEIFEKIDVIEDKLMIENSEEKIKNLEFEHRLSQKQSQINQLEKEKELANIISVRNTLIMGLLVFFILGISIILFLVIRSRKAKIADNLIISKQALELNIQTNQLKKLNDIKDKTFSILSHDLKSPLVSLQQTLYLLDENQIDKEEFLFIKDSLIEKFSNLNHLLENLLNWSKARISGEFNSKPDYINIYQILNQNIQLFKPQWESKGIKILFEIEENQLIYADHPQIDMVIRNIFNNAIKFSFTGGTIRIYSKIVENKFKLFIHDFGTGMNAKEVEQINQGNLGPSKLGTSGEKGTGIGLMISRDFVIENKGNLSISSDANSGTCVCIELPISYL